jgi:hypothetical protein
MADQKCITVGITDLCEMLDLARRRISQKVKMNVIPKPISRDCYDVEASLTATAATRRRLLDALLAEALAPVDARELEAAD